jgi:hypothetical protein
LNKVCNIFGGFLDPQYKPTTNGLELMRFLTAHNMGQNSTLELLNKGRPSKLNCNKSLLLLKARF